MGDKSPKAIKKKNTQKQSKKGKQKLPMESAQAEKVGIKRK